MILSDAFTALSHSSASLVGTVGPIAPHGCCPVVAEVLPPQLNVHPPHTRASTSHTCIHLTHVHPPHTRAVGLRNAMPGM